MACGVGMVIWTLAAKDLRVLLRDPRSVVILLVMPIVFILVLGVSLGEGFGKKPAEGLRVSVVNLDRGLPRYFDRPAMIREGAAWLTLTPASPAAGGLNPHLFTACGLALRNQHDWFPRVSWADLVLDDLAQTAGISVEIIPNIEEARRLVRSSRRAAVLVLGPDFSRRVSRSSFLAGGWRETLAVSCAFPRPGLPSPQVLLALFDESQTAVPLYFLDGINPFHRDGVKLSEIDVQVLRDQTQEAAAAIIDQVTQTTLLRVVLPWMIGRAFGKVGDPEFIDLLAREKIEVRALGFKVPLAKILQTMTPAEKQALGSGLQNALQTLYSKYNLTAKTWASLTKSLETLRDGAAATEYAEDGAGWLKRGAMRYQLLVPSYIVMFAFFLVLTVGWLFVAERRQGTLLRLRAAPITHTELLAGKLIPCLFMSLFQGYFLLAAGKLIFGMSWGPTPLWLVPVVAATSLAAMGMALFVAALARTESQVAIYGTLLVLVLAALSGTLMGDRSLMPEQMQELSRFTPHAWALDAYRQLLTSSAPSIEVVAKGCGVLAGFGAGFIVLAWWMLKWD